MNTRSHLMCWTLAEQPHLSLQTAGFHTSQMCSIFPYILIISTLIKAEDLLRDQSLLKIGKKEGPRRSQQWNSLIVGIQKLHMSFKLLAYSGVRGIDSCLWMT